jgi:ATP-dependent RNA helicase DOB1
LISNGFTAGGGGEGFRRIRKGAPDMQRVVKCVLEHQLDPAIVFAFSRKECEALALQLTRSGKLVMTTPEEQQV